MTKVQDCWRIERWWRGQDEPTKARFASSTDRLLLFVSGVERRSDHCLFKHELLQINQNSDSTALYVKTIKGQIEALQASKKPNSNLVEINLGSLEQSGPVDKSYGTVLSKTFKNLWMTSSSICALVTIYTGVGFFPSISPLFLGSVS